MPPLTLENAAALVPGGVTASDIAKENKLMQPQKSPQPQTVNVRVLRSFQNQERKVLEKGATTVLPRLFALEMKAANKVEFIVEEAPAPTPPAKESLFATGRKEK